MAVEVRRVIGGAGTGKTTALMQEIEQAAGVYGIDAIGFSSMTRAARSEAVSRASAAFGVDAQSLTRDGWFRTVHSAAYKALQIQPGQIVGEGDNKWFSDVFQLPMRAAEDSDTFQIRVGGDPDVAAAISAWNLARATLTDLRTACDTIGANFAVSMPLVDRYERAKRIHGRIDYTDILASFIGAVWPSVDAKPVRRAPAGELPDLAMWLFDECQDASRLLDLCCRRLASAKSVRKVILVGDPFQSIYSFSGSSARHFMGWAVNDQKILDRSWRCPSAILNLGESTLRNMRGEYWDRGIKPSRDGGAIQHEFCVDSMVSHVRVDKSWLLLARSNFGASQIARAATAAGIPWQWNKSADDEKTVERRAGYRAATRLESGDRISPGEVKSLMGVLPSRSEAGSLWKRGSKIGFVPEQREGELFTTADLETVGGTSVLAAIIRSGDWATFAAGGAAKRYRETVAQFGMAIADDPPIRVGTIHSAKGAEADAVGLVDSISHAGARDQENTDAVWNEERRVEYVGVTRAKDRLVIAHLPSPLSVLY